MLMENFYANKFDNLDDMEVDRGTVASSQNCEGHGRTTY